ncbi:MAG: hypothetical protein QM757_17415 [Paludibaculum sp.]
MLDRTKSRRVVRGAAVLLGAVLSVWASPGSTPAEWRSWDSSDGMNESYAHAITLDPAGRLWVVHGAVPNLSILDGYRTTHVPTPGRGSNLAVGASGEAWALNGDGLFHLEKGRWVRRAVPGFEEEKLTGSGRVAVDEQGGVLLAGADRLYHYDGVHQKTAVLWRSESGLGRLEAVARDAAGTWLVLADGIAFRPKGSRQWSEFSSTKAGLTGLSRPWADGSGALMLGGREQISNRAVLVEFDHGKWTVLYRGGRVPVWGWRSGGVLWRLEGNWLYTKNSDGWARVEKRGAMGGLIYDAVPDGRSTFWVATSQGVARHFEPVWRTPEGADSDQIVSGIVEDERKRLWFLHDSMLLLNDQGRWSRYELPEEMKPKTLHTGSSTALGGRFYFLCENGKLASFRPESAQFGWVNHPSGRMVRTANVSPDGRLLAITREPGKSIDQVEMFDGERYSPLQQLPERGAGRRRPLDGAIGRWDSVDLRRFGTVGLEAGPTRFRRPSGRPHGRGRLSSGGSGAGPAPDGRPRCGFAVERAKLEGAAWRAGTGPARFEGAGWDYLDCSGQWRSSSQRRNDDYERHRRGAAHGCLVHALRG